MPDHAAETQSEPFDPDEFKPRDLPTTVLIAERLEAGTYRHIKGAEINDLAVPAKNRDMPSDASDDAKLWYETPQFAGTKGWLGRDDATLPPGIDRVHYFVGWAT